MNSAAVLPQEVEINYLLTESELYKEIIKLRPGCIEQAIAWLFLGVSMSYIVYICIYIYIVYMSYTGETCQCGGQWAYGVHTCI